MVGPGRSKVTKVTCIPSNLMQQVSELGPHRQLAQALELFEVMQRFGKLPNLVNHSALTNACEKGNRPEPALGLGEIIQQQGVVPNAISYDILISIFEKGKPPGTALKLLETMQRQGVVSNAITYSA